MVRGKGIPCARSRQHEQSEHHGRETPNPSSCLRCRVPGARLHGRARHRTVFRDDGGLYGSGADTQERAKAYTQDAEARLPRQRPGRARSRRLEVHTYTWRLSFATSDFLKHDAEGGVFFFFLKKKKKKKKKNFDKCRQVTRLRADSHVPTTASMCSRRRFHPARPSPDCSSSRRGSSTGPACQSGSRITT